MRILPAIPNQPLSLEMLNRQDGSEHREVIGGKWGISERPEYVTGRQGMAAFAHCLLPTLFASKTPKLSAMTFFPFFSHPPKSGFSGRQCLVCSGVVDASQAENDGAERLS